MESSEIERKLLRAIQNGMPMSKTPYRELGKTIGIPAEQVLENLRQWQADGRIRRLGAIVNHFQMGHGAGAMVAWDVPEDRIDEVGQLFASFSEASHVYLRPSAKQWPYNLYTMVHASSDSELDTAIHTMNRKSGITKFCECKTIRELKKVPPTYILE